MPVITAAVCTLGCKVNQYDTETLTENLTRRGFKIVDFDRPADIYVINTCSVTHIADRKSRQMIRKARHLNAGTRVAVCGCMAKLSPTITRETGADFVFDAREPSGFFSWLDRLFLPSPCAAADKTNRRVRAYCKIQEGCDRFCAYCIVPYARGPVQSRPAHAVIAEAEALIGRGVKEIVLSGIHAASYGKDLDTSLPVLMDAIASLGGLARLRLSSIEPCAADEHFLRVIAKRPVICGHFHLSLQSGCDDTLARMNRRYTAARYAEAASLLRAARPGTALTTDIIVGFPGETDADFEESLRFAEQMRFARVHVFEYSSRQGTPAASFAGQVPAEVKKQRGRRMRQLAAGMEAEYLNQFIGINKEVLFETEKDGGWEGHTDNYLLVRVPAAGKDVWNQLVNVRLEAREGSALTGAII